MLCLNRFSSLLCLFLAFSSFATLSAQEKKEEEPTVAPYKVWDAVQKKPIANADIKAALKVEEHSYYFSSENDKAVFEKSIDDYAKVINAQFVFYSNQVIKQYIYIQRLLSQDSIKNLKAHACALKELCVLAKTLSPKLEKVTLKIYCDLLAKIEKGAETLSAQEKEDIAETRKTFAEISASALEFSKTFHAKRPGAFSVFAFHSDAAFGDKGADWLQDCDVIANPYTGAKDSKNGKLVETIMANCEYMPLIVSNPKIFVEEDGFRVYFCCHRCVGAYQIKQGGNPKPKTQKPQKRK